MEIVTRMAQVAVVNIRYLVQDMMDLVTLRTVTQEPIIILRQLPVRIMQTNSKISLNGILLIVVVICGLVFTTLSWRLVTRKNAQITMTRPVTTVTPPLQPNVLSASPTISSPVELNSEQPKLDAIHIFPTGDVVTAQPVQPTIAMKPIEIGSDGFSFSTLILPFRNKYPFKNNAGKNLTIQVSGAHTEQQTIKNNEVTYLDFTSSGSYTVSCVELGKSAQFQVN